MAGYFRLSTSSDEEVHAEKEVQHPRSSPIWKWIPWIWCSVCTTITVLTLVYTTIALRQFESQCQIQAPETPEAEIQAPQKDRANFPTDFITAPEIPYVEKYYYNYWDFNPYIRHLEINRTMLHVGPLYAGPPSKTVDDAWAELLDGAYMQATEEEVEAAQAAAPWDLEKINGNIYMEVGVFHNLHCIDLLRRALSPDVYNTHTDFSGQLREKYRQTHIYHCIEHLRNAVQCHGDMTPVPLFTIPELPGFVASHSVSHTCRDFEKIKEWKNERNKLREPYGY